MNFLPRNQRGLSAIIVTLIMILLVIVAAGIIWGVVQNIVGDSSEQIESGTACFNVDLQVLSVANRTAAMDDYDVRLSRTGADSTLGGIRVQLLNDTTESEVVEFGTMSSPETRTQNVTLSAVLLNPTQIKVTPYLEGGRNCQTITEDI